MPEFEQVYECLPQFTRSRQLNETGQHEEVVLYAQHGRTADGFLSLYTQRNRPAAPALDERFDEQARAVYGGLDPKTVFFPPAKREQYRRDNPQLSADELEDIAGALNGHGARCLELTRKLFRLPNMVWLGLAGGTGQVFIEGGEAANKELAKTPDERGWFMRSPATDVGIVAPRKDSDEKITLAMGVADCLAIPVVDTKTRAFAFAHAGRPGTGLRTAERAARGLLDTYDSRPEDIVAFLGEGVCTQCYRVDEATLDGFIADFGGRAAVSEVTRQYPQAVQEVGSPEGKRFGLDLYAFNKYLLARQKIGEILVAPNCTARTSPECQTLAGREVPAEHAQQYFSHERVKRATVGWATADGASAQLPAFLLTTPRNLAIVTRF